MECSSDITCHMPYASDGSDDDNPSNGNSGSNPPLGSSDVLVYFEILANQGLQGLEVEHSSTLERSMIANSYYVVCTDLSIPAASTMPSEEGTTISIKSIAGGCRCDTKSTAVHTAVIPANCHLFGCRGLVCIPGKRRPSCHQCSVGLCCGCSLSGDRALLMAAITSHGIVTAGPLATFRRSTPKAQAASANLMRRAALSETVLQLWSLIFFSGRKWQQLVMAYCHHDRPIIIHDGSYSGSGWQGKLIGGIRL
jgi:hypothetical protein